MNECSPSNSPSACRFLLYFGPETHLAWFRFTKSWCVCLCESKFLGSKDQGFQSVWPFKRSIKSSLPAIIALSNTLLFIEFPREIRVILNSTPVSVLKSLLFLSWRILKEHRNQSKKSGKYKRNRVERWRFRWCRVVRLNARPRTILGARSTSIFHEFEKDCNVYNSCNARGCTNSFLENEFPRDQISWQKSQKRTMQRSISRTTHSTSNFDPRIVTCLFLLSQTLTLSIEFVLW